VSYIVLPSPLSSLSPSFSLLNLLLFGCSILCVFIFPIPLFPCPGHTLPLSLTPSFSPGDGSDLKDIQNNKNRYLIASENQRPGHFSTAPIGSLTASPSSGSLCNQGLIQSVTSIQERIMSTPGGEEAIERLKVKQACVDCSSRITLMFGVKKEEKSTSIAHPTPLRLLTTLCFFSLPRGAESCPMLCCVGQQAGL